MATETSPLIPQQSSLRAPGRPPRTVTFNPTVATASPRTSPNRAPITPITPSTPPKTASGVPGQPVLSALNSKLRRRHSHGAPLQQPMSAPAGPKIGAQRTTKHAQKLKLLPDPDQGEVAADDESGRDVYSQFTRIKDPMARRDAARLGKEDRDKLPRVTAYCTANGLKLEECMRWLRSRGRIRGAQPKLFDECIYSTYSYDKDNEGHTDGFRRSGQQIQLDGTSESRPLLRSSTPPPQLRNERRYSDSAVEIEGQHEQKREELIDTGEGQIGNGTQQDQAHQQSPDRHAIGGSPPLVPASHSTTHLENTRDHNPDFDTTVHTPEVFLFDYGTVVIWGMTFVEEQRFLKEIARFETEKLRKDDIQAENFNFYYTRDYQARIYNDFISLRDKRNYMTKLAISHALAQSVKTSLYEDLVDNTIGETQNIPSQLASTGRTGLSRRQIAMRIGELFILRINIHLQGSVLDSPELMWTEPGLEPIYAAARGYLELDSRCGLLTERLDVIADLLAVLKDQSGQVHGEFLEWIVIVLIAAEIIVAAVNIVVDLYAGVD